MRPGSRVGKYELGERIAVGGMAEVWAGRAVGPEGFVKPVAIKFILETFSGDAQFERLFVNEARLAAALQHPNLVSVFDFDKVPDEGDQRLRGRYYIVMELVEGHDLRRMLLALQRQKRTLPVPIALYVAGEVLKGLRYLHERSEGGRPLGLIHRDVSPHNVMLDVHGQVKVSDFGIAKAMSQSLGTQAGMIRGKLAYASPEQIRGEAVNAMTDQFAAGVILWEMLAGRRLFHGSSDAEVIASVARCHVPLLSSLGREVAPGIEAVVRRMLASRATDRFPATSEALAALLRAPGYCSDGLRLGALMAELLPASPVETGATEPLRPAAVAATVLLAHQEPASKAAATVAVDDDDIVSVDVLSEAETRTRVPASTGRACAEAGPVTTASGAGSGAMTLSPTPSLPPVATESSDAIPGPRAPDSTAHLGRRWWRHRHLQSAAGALLLLAVLGSVARLTYGRVAARITPPQQPAPTSAAALPPARPTPLPPEAVPSPVAPEAVPSPVAPEAVPPPVAPEAVLPPVAPAPAPPTVAPAPAPPTSDGPAVATEAPEPGAAPARASARAGGPQRQESARRLAVAGEQLAAARAAFEGGELPRAVREARRALQAGAGAAALTLLGDCLFKLGRTQEARQAYAQALRKDPRNAAAQHGIQVLAATP